MLQKSETWINYSSQIPLQFFYCILQHGFEEYFCWFMGTNVIGTWDLWWHITNKINRENLKNMGDKKKKKTNLRWTFQICRSGVEQLQIYIGNKSIVKKKNYYSSWTVFITTWLGRERERERESHRVEGSLN